MTRRWRDRCDLPEFFSGETINPPPKGYIQSVVASNCILFHYLLLQNFTESCKHIYPFPLSPLPLPPPSQHILHPISLSLASIFLSFLLPGIFFRHCRSYSRSLTLPQSGPFRSSDQHQRLRRDLLFLRLLFIATSSSLLFVIADFSAIAPTNLFFHKWISDCHRRKVSSSSTSS